ncbi:hypothetical protein GQ53DRAFT_827418 [Thozetella sp. PMI_491]|nr:hypothetical protein GQ53DRAFT_827418 [Thozetella sp. PMI_491]
MKKRVILFIASPLAGAMSNVAETKCIGFQVTLTPRFDANNSVSALQVDQFITGNVFRNRQKLVTLATWVAGVDAGFITAEGLTARDDEGILSLGQSSETGADGNFKMATWLLMRSTTGPVRISYTALPREVSAATRNGPSLDLRKDHGGMIGSGYGFLAVPPDQRNPNVSITLQWNLSSAPPSTTAAWSFGDGTHTKLDGLHHFSKLQQVFYAVGPLKSLAGGERGDTGELSAFNIYWLGSPNLEPFKLGRRLHSIFEKMRDFFRDSGDSYRIFMRYNPFAGSNTGTALARSFTYGYDDTEQQYPLTFLQRERVLAHEMVHNWVLLGGPSDNWYTEGLAEYYQLLLRYRLGLIMPRVYIGELNDMLQAYFTNPLVSENLDEVSKITWNTSHAQRVPYGRGFAFGLQMNGLIREASAHQKSLDDVVVEMVVRSQEGEPVTILDYLTLCGSYLHDDSLPRLLVSDMQSGNIVVPTLNSVDGVPFPLRLVRKDLYSFELGFEERSILEGSHTITGLLEGSRAEDSGLRNGDQVRLLYSSAYNAARSSYDATLSLKVKRVGQEPFVVEFWPRSRKRVEAYQYEIIENDDL